MGGIFPAPKVKADAKALQKKPSIAEACQSSEFARIAGFVIPLERPSGRLPLRAAFVGKGTVPDPATVAAYLERAFKGNLDPVRQAMETAAANHTKATLEHSAMRFYEQFRPQWKGWGVPGELRLTDIRSVGRK